MTYIKRLVIQGFKSFAKRTEIPFDQAINVIIGPNGSGKSNISDALCFALGRLSIKSMRAAKARNLIFMGSKFVKPSHEASVELVFDNEKRDFAIDATEIVLKRIVRTNGQSIYKINDETKTRAEVVEMLAQAGIDPHGFNMILQGHIQGLVKMHPEERRKIIEEVAGIAIYESRKEKSLHELDKTEEKFKEINTILRERSAFLKNLEEEKTQAEKHKNLQLMEKRLKASIFNRKIEDKNKEIDSIIKSVESKMELKNKVKTKIDELNKEIETLTARINEINGNIKKSTGLEQETLHNHIANLKAELEGQRVRKENFERRKNEILHRIGELKASLPGIENEIKELKERSPLVAKKTEELKKKKGELAEIEVERKKALTIKTELNSLKERIRDKELLLNRTRLESESNLKQMEVYSSGLTFKSDKHAVSELEKTQKEIEGWQKQMIEVEKTALESEKVISVSESDITRNEEVKNKVEKIDICPLCQSKITAEHITHVFTDANNKIEKAKEDMKNFAEKLKKAKEDKIKLYQDLDSARKLIQKCEREIIGFKTVEERKEQLKKILENEKLLASEISEMENKRKSIEEKITNINSIEERYEKTMFEIEEIQSRNEENLDNSMMFKERDLESIKGVIKRSITDCEDLDINIGEISEKIEAKNVLLAHKEKEEKELNEKFKRLFEERDKIQKTIQEESLRGSELANETRQIEDQINYLKVGKARFDAEKEALEIEIKDFVGVELVKGSLNFFEERLAKVNEDLMKIGAINMRALEVYESVKKEYDAVQEKVNILSKEKEDILRIIEEIDRKKKKTFMKTFTAINQLFTENFARLSSKGLAYLEFENTEDIFAGGVNIIVKLAKGKYFDVSSLSGGEQTLVALSLLFAIQEYKPYHFYIFDEIDAALDKRNSERLAALLNQYMKAGQYIVVTHNDALITNSNCLFGVSMHEGVSKVLSLKVE